MSRAQVEERECAGLLLDVAATDHLNVAHLITDGLAGVECSVLPLVGLVAKARREATFPSELLERGMEVDIEKAEASHEIDKKRILNVIAYPRSETKALDGDFPTEHANYSLVNRALASHFALASFHSGYTRQVNALPLLKALQADEGRRTMQLSLTGCLNFQDEDLRSLLAHLPAQLQILRLDLCFTGLRAWSEDFEVAALSLHHLQLRLTGAICDVSGLPALIHPSLKHLELWFANLPELENIPLNAALGRLRRLEQLVMLVDGCPKVPPPSKQALRPASIFIIWFDLVEPAGVPGLLW